jgi:hypothetical protein
LRGIAGSGVGRNGDRKAAEGDPLRKPYARRRDL